MNSKQILKYIKWNNYEVCSYHDEDFDNLTFQFMFDFNPNNDIWLEPFKFSTEEYFYNGIQLVPVNATQSITTIKTNNTVIIVFLVLITIIIVILIVYRFRIKLSRLYHTQYVNIRNRLYPPNAAEV